MITLDVVRENELRSSLIRSAANGEVDTSGDNSASDSVLDRTQAIISQMRPHNCPVPRQIQVQDPSDASLGNPVPFFMQPRKHYPRKLDDSFLYSKIERQSIL